MLNSTGHKFISAVKKGIIRSSVFNENNLQTNRAKINSIKKLYITLEFRKLRKEDARTLQFIFFFLI